MALMPFGHELAFAPLSEVATMIPVLSSLRDPIR
jgi:hypothetical protein